LMLWSVIFIIACIVWLGYATWPFMFAEHVISDEEAHLALGHKTEEGKAFPDFPWADLKGKDADKIDDAIAFAWFWRLTTAGIAFFLLIMHSLVVIGGVKMQQLESYGWGMTAAILTILFGTFFGLLLGIWCIMVLRDPKVIKAFEHE